MKKENRVFFKTEYGSGYNGLPSLWSLHASAISINGRLKIEIYFLAG